MIIIQVRQLINGEWVHLGDIQEPRGYTKAVNYIDELQDKMASGDTMFTFRMGIGNLLAVNMNHGPVKFNMQE